MGAPEGPPCSHVATHEEIEPQQQDLVDDA